MIRKTLQNVSFSSNKLVTAPNRYLMPYLKLVRSFGDKMETGLLKEFDDHTIPKYKRTLIDADYLEELAPQFEESGFTKIGDAPTQYDAGQPRIRFKSKFDLLKEVEFRVLSILNEYGDNTISNIESIDPKTSFEALGNS